MRAADEGFSHRGGAACTALCSICRIEPGLAATLTSDAAGVTLELIATHAAKMRTTHISDYLLRSLSSSVK